MARLGVPEIDFEELEALSEDMPAPAPVDIGRDDLAEVMFTSGTTGDPKGVMLTHRNITANIASVVQVAAGKESDRLMSILPLSHMLEQMGGLLVPMRSGANITYPTARQATVLFRTMKERRVTMMVLVPQLLDLFMKGIEREVRRQGKDALWAKLMKVAATTLSRFAVSSSARCTRSSEASFPSSSPEGRPWTRASAPSGTCWESGWYRAMGQPRRHR